MLCKAAFVILMYFFFSPSLLLKVLGLSRDLTTHIVAYASPRASFSQNYYEGGSFVQSETDRERSYSPECPRLQQHQVSRFSKPNGSPSSSSIRSYAEV